MSLRVGIVGCGLVGQRRAAVAKGAGDQVIAVADLDAAKAAQVAQECGAESSTDWGRLVERPDIDAVVVSTANSALPAITTAALGRGKHVLREKPLGRNAGEASRMVEAAQRNGRCLKTGFNHRHHPAIWKARELVRQGAIGPLMFIRAVYGHGGRPGYDKEWRWTQWKNRFSFEVFGRAGSLGIEGLGGSYGTETLTITRRSEEGGTPKQETEQFPGPDDSWRLEWQEFVSAIREGRQPLANGQDGLATMKLIGALYESAWTGQVVNLTKLGVGSEV